MKRNNVKVKPFSSYLTERFYIECCSTSTAPIVSKMVELAARKCDCYASDVVVWANDFIKHVEEEKEYSKILFFQNDGVDCKDIVGLEETESDIYFNTHEQCAWRLEHSNKYDPEINGGRWISTLTRVTVSKRQ